MFKLYNYECMVAKLFLTEEIFIYFYQIFSTVLAIFSDIDRKWQSQYAKSGNFITNEDKAYTLNPAWFIRYLQL